MAEDYIEFNEFRTAETAEPNDELLLQTPDETKRITVEAYNRPLSQAIENTRNEVNLLSDEVDRVNEKIPSTVTPDNQLTTQDYVNEAIQTNSAVNRGSFETYADLMAYEGTVTRNDYAYVADDESHKHESWRYKWNDDTHEWTPEYRINEAPMTLAQLAALNSGITAELLNRLLGGTTTPVGTMSLYWGAVAPVGYLMCDRSYSADDYPELWAVLPDEVKDTENRIFNLDLRELVPVGAGQSESKDIEDHDVYEVGQFKDDQLQEHTHTYTLRLEGTDTPYLMPGLRIPSAGADVLTSEQSGRKGTTTHGKQFGINYIVKY